MCEVSQMHIRYTCKTPLEPIVLYIQLRKKVIGICEKCWKKIGDKDWEIGRDPRPTFEQLIGSYEGKVTEYVQKSTVKEEKPEEDLDW
jgi:hypothetical protein